MDILKPGGINYYSHIFALPKLIHIHWDESIFGSGDKHLRITLDKFGHDIYLY